MRQILNNWRLFFRSLAVPTLLIASPIVLARYWRAWRHFLTPLEALTQCGLVVSPVLLSEAVGAFALAILFNVLLRRHTVQPAATEICSDILTFLVLGYAAFRFLNEFNFLGRILPLLVSAVGTGGLILMRLRGGQYQRLRLDQFNRSSEAILPIYVLAMALLLPTHVVLRRFDPVPTDPRSSSATRQRPDVVLITFDALSAQDASLFHYRLPTTPNFEQLAKTSYVFSHFYSSSDFTTPAVVSLLTGKDLFSHRVYQLTGMVPAGIRDQNLAHVLAANGYRTAAVVTNNYAHPLHLGIDASFDYLPEPPANPWLRPLNWPLQLGHSMLFDSAASPTSWIVPFLGVAGKYFPSFNQNPNVDPFDVFALSERLIDSVPGPLFIWIHLLPPHFPYMTVPPFRGRFAAGDSYTTQADFDAARRLGHYQKATAPVFSLLRARYDESIAECDAALGSFLKWMDARGRRGETLMVVSADHGEAFHQWWGHASPALLYPEVHIPLLISLPGQKEAKWHDEDCGLADVAPTILAALGIGTPKWMTGRDLLSASPEHSRQPAFAAYLARSYTSGEPRIGAVAAFSGDYELVWYFPPGLRRLFDIRRNPEDVLDVTSEHPEVAASLARAIVLKYGGQVPALRDE